MPISSGGYAGRQITVGVAVRIEHSRATRVGDRVEVSAESPAAAAGRRLTFAVQALGISGVLIASGQIDRALVDRERFLDAATGTEPGPGRARENAG